MSSIRYLGGCDATYVSERELMLVESLVKATVELQGFRVESVTGATSGLVAVVVADLRFSPRCGQCLEPARYRDTRPVRRFRHVPMWGIPVELRYEPRRVSCPRCAGVHVEAMPWVSGKQRMTRALVVTLATWTRLLPWGASAARDADDRISGCELEVSEVGCLDQLAGTYATATISTSLTADAKAKSAAVPQTEGALTVGSTTPHRVGASLPLTLEDIAAVGAANFEAVLRENVSLALSAELDDQIINGAGASLKRAISGIRNRRRGVSGPETLSLPYRHGRT